MASVPQQHDLVAHDVDRSKAQLPGDTVDALLAEGKVDEARQELERLLLDGLTSGPARQTDQALFDDIVAKARSRWRRPQR